MMKRHGRAAADQSYGGVFVYNRPEQVLEQYDLEVRAVSKGRESYICDTTQGQLLTKARRSGQSFSLPYSGIWVDRDS